MEQNNRTIKFRARTVSPEGVSGKWVYGQYFMTPLTDENSGVPTEKGWFFLADGVTRHCIVENGVVYVIDRNTLGQFTGILDGNDVEIYEHDIIEHDASEIYQRNRFISDVRWDRGAFFIKAMLLYRTGHPEMNKERSDKLVDIFTLRYTKVIGNMIDSRELLK